MCLRKRNYLLLTAISGFLFYSDVFATVIFEPGVGFGVEYTDNATLIQDDKIEDLIFTSYVGGRAYENEGSLRYDVAALFNKYNYTQDSYEDQRFLNLAASADWEMIKDHFNWTLSNLYSQVPVLSLSSNTPDNIQDSNVFSFGANIRSPISARQSFSLIPLFTQYYYEVLPTDNKQYSLAANWNYQMFRLTNVGLNISTRKINYTEISITGQSIEDTTFTNMAMLVNGQRLRSTFSVNLGATNVKRDNGDETTGFSGYLNWFTDLSSRSSFATVVSTDLTDTSTVAAGVAGDPGNGDVQITADVIRNSIFNLAYLRDDASLRTHISAQYRKLNYSESPLDSIIRDFDMRFEHPVTQLVSSSIYANYNRNKQLDTSRLDKRFIVGGNLRYRFSRKVHGLFDLKYRKKESTFAPENFDEFSVFVSLVYGFGDVLRATRLGGF